MISLTRASSCPHTALVEDSDRSRAWLDKLIHAYSSLKESYARNTCYFAAGDSLLICSDTPFFAHFALTTYVKHVTARCLPHPCKGSAPVHARWCLQRKKW